MKSTLKQANDLLRKGRYEEALHKYEQIQRDDSELANLVHFNIQLIDKHLKRWLKEQKSAIEVAQTSVKKKSTLEKPKYLDQHIFDKILESDLFDIEWYLSEYQEKQRIKDNPLAHYLTYGVHQRLNPSQGFDTYYYIESNPDVAEADMNPFLHYVLQGRAEGRQPIPLHELAFESYPTVDEVKYIPRLEPDAEPVSKAVRVIAFYLPQFHPIPENDEWWGKGFTEWTNVKPSKPQFEGHYQPHVPDDFIGHYNLLDRTMPHKQIELAKQYGIEGFCFYLYWFSGKRLLEQPVDNYLKDPALNLPFCVCWANENWSRRWDGLENDLLMVQNYSDQDDLDFIANIARYLCDPRYIRIDGKPLLLIYRPNLFPDMRATARRWRDWCQAEGVGEIYLAYPQAFECVEPAIYGFDAAVEFPPNNSSPPNITSQVKPTVDGFQSTVYDWRVFIERSKNYQEPGYKLFRGATPSWDNTARKKNKGIVFHNGCPKLFSQWLTNAFVDTLARFDQPDEQIVFINAWNEWAEGAHLEPDQRYGYAWLNAVLTAHRGIKNAYASKIGIHAHVYYLDVFEDIINRLNKIKLVKFKLYVTIREELYASISDMLKSVEFEYQIFVFDNRGRDVLPFIQVIDLILNDSVDIILKIHTKKSKHRNDGDRWRNAIYDDLLDEKQMINSIKNLYENDDIGIISAENQIVPMSYYWGSNETTVINLSSKIGVPESRLIGMNFVAGTMFFIRPELVSKMLELELTVSDFEAENGQVDGTLAHALERMFGVICYASDMKIVTNNGKNINHDFEFADKVDI